LFTKSGLPFQEILHPLHYKGSSYVKVRNSFILPEMYYSSTFSKMVHDWKRQSTSLGNFDSTFVIVRNFHDPWLNKNMKII
jgi:hypothetical protein